MGLDKDEQGYIFYRDDELERLLKESKEHNYIQITQLFDTIKTNFINANTQYKAQNDAFNMKIRQYYFTILWESVVNFFYFCIFSAPYFSSSTQDKIAKERTTLDNKLNEEQEIWSELLSPLSQASTKLLGLKNDIEVMETELTKTELSIQDPEIEQSSDLPIYVQKRDALTAGIIKLYQSIDNEMVILDKLPISTQFVFEKNSYVGYKNRQEQQIKALLDATNSIDHPVANALRAVLINRTTTSKKNLREALSSYPDYLADHMLADAVWEVSLYFPEITLAMQRESEVVKFIDAQEVKLGALQKQIEMVDAEFRKKSLPDILQRLEEMCGRKRELSELIHKVLRDHEKSIADPKSPIHTKLLEIATSRIEEDVIQKLRALCEPITHPIAKELHHYLMYQTTTSLNELKKLLDESIDFQNEPMLVNILWEAGRLFSDLRVIDSKNPKQVMIEQVAEFEHQIETLMAKRVLVVEKIEGLKEVARRWNADLNEVNIERQALRDEPSPIKKAIRELTNESLRIVGQLSSNAERLEATELELHDMDVKLLDLQTAQKSYKQGGLVTSARPPSEPSNKRRVSEVLKSALSQICHSSDSDTGSEKENKLQKPPGQG